MSDSIVVADTAGLRPPTLNRPDRLTDFTTEMLNQRNAVLLDSVADDVVRAPPLISRCVATTRLPCAGGERG